MEHCLRQAHRSGHCRVWVCASKPRDRVGESRLVEQKAVGEKFVMSRDGQCFETPLSWDGTVAPTQLPGRVGDQPQPGYLVAVVRLSGFTQFLTIFRSHHALEILG